MSHSARSRRHDGSLETLLKAHLAGAADLSAHDVACAASLFTERRVTKGTPLLAPGDVCRFEGIVIEGCLRAYTTEPDGSENVLYFAPEGWWFGDPESLLTRQPARSGIDAVEGTHILSLNRDAALRLAQETPMCERLLRVAAEHTLARLHRRLVGRMRKTAAQRYLDFRSLYPNLDVRIPQYQIAAYVGVSAEFLCRLRRRFRTRH